MSAPASAAANDDAPRPQEHLLLKWGTLKGWNLYSETALSALKRYNAGGLAASGAMFQQDTPDQKQAIYDLIDAVDGPIINDFSGERYTKDEAKDYVREYRA